ncbi:hypothetical protein ES705_26732 [subsurface metagenome]
MSYGYTKNILHIDLSSKKHWIENPPENFYRTYWGGKAIGLYYMLKEMKPYTDPLSPDNLLIQRLILGIMLLNNQKIKNIYLLRKENPKWRQFSNIMM